MPEEENDPEFQVTDVRQGTPPWLYDFDLDFVVFRHGGLENLQLPKPLEPCVVSTPKAKAPDVWALSNGAGSESSSTLMTTVGA